MATIEQDSTSSRWEEAGNALFTACEGQINPSALRAFRETAEIADVDAGVELALGALQDAGGTLPGEVVDDLLEAFRGDSFEDRLRGLLVRTRVEP